MSALGSVEPLNVAVVTPREAAAREYLLSAGRPLTRQQLRDIVSNTHKLHAEFAVSKRTVCVSEIISQAEVINKVRSWLI